MELDDAALSGLFNVTTGVWAIASILGIMAWRMWNGLPAVMAQWIAWRAQKAAEREAREKAIAEAKDSDWKRIRSEVDRLVERVAFLEGKVDECERERLEWMERAIKAESVLIGQGDVRQAAALAAAEVRVEADKKQAREKRETDRGQGI